jgi:hypothetical protein
VDAREEALRVGGAPEAPGRIEHRGKERAAVDARLGREAREVEDGREDVGERDLGAAAAAQRPGGPDDEGHGRGRVVHEEAVGGLAVLAQAFPVVRGHHEERAVEELPLAEARDEAAHEVVREGHLRLVGVGGKARPERLGGVVRKVRVEEMDPGEELPRPHLVDPGERVVHDRVAPLLELVDCEAVGVAVEALGEAEAPLEDPRAHESPRGEARALEPLRQRRPRLGKRNAAVVADAVARREEAGQDRAVGRQGQRDGGRCLLEEDGLGGELVEVGSRASGETVTTQSICSESVQGDQNDIQ